MNIPEGTNTDLAEVMKGSHPTILRFNFRMKAQEKRL